MHILIVARWPVGGIRTYLQYMLGDEVMEGKEFTILAPDYSYTRQLQKDLANKPVRFVFCSDQTLPFSKALATLLWKQKFDAIHAHGFTAAGLSSVVSLLAPRTKLMHSFHDVFFDHHFKGSRGKLYRLAVRFMFRRAKVINVLGMEAEQNLFQFFPNTPKQKVVAIRNGVDTHKFAEAEAVDLREQHQLDDNVFLIGFLGRFMGQKGFKYLFQAIKNLSSRNDLPLKPLVIAVDAAGGFEEQEKKAIKDANLQDYFQFIPFNPNIGGVVKGLDLLTMPSVWECCPLMPMEALAAGVPVAGSNCIGLNEVLQDSPAFIFKVSDVASLEEVIVKAMEEENLKTRFVQFAPVAIDRFSSQHAAAKLAAVYDRLAI